MVLQSLTTPQLQLRPTGADAEQKPRLTPCNDNNDNYAGNT